ncbi:hypothetical protein BDV95DRAFT_668071 [Massariosphaeria phaeospora]|uniref:Uncharacterized protein n=1 Tax=Massariosphaeria phaeospora TaxID=100035 RepID=A0A7C8M5S6_9PLEO|nr:hypothetical protein BDV95DRAFT_668071 [Massariosphaeria phaeospora]
MFLSRNSAYIALSLAIVRCVQTETLVPIRPLGVSSNSKRQEPSGLDLRNTETFLWGDADMAEVTVANLTVYMPDDSENIVNMENFESMLGSVECSESSISMTFQDNAAFTYAQRVWEWVDQKENNSFVMVVPAGQCGNGTSRRPFVVSSVEYEPELDRAILATARSDWQTIAHSYDLVVGSVTQDTISNKVRRDIDKSTTIDFVHDFPFSFAISSGPLEARIACTNCSSTGQFDMEFKISQKLFVPTGASMTVKPKGVSAVAQVKFTGAGSVTDALTKTFDIVQIPLAGVNVPGVMEFGPQLTFAVGAELSAITVSAGVTSGATAKFSNDAILEMNLLNPDNNKFSGWEPEIDAIEVTVDGSITGGVAIFLQPSMELKAEALGQGFEIGLNMRVPNINAKLSAIASPAGACPAAAVPEGTAKRTLGVNLSANIGAELNIQALKTGERDPLFTVQIAAGQTLNFPLAQKCFPFGDEIAARSIRESAVYP